jgi:hypothetical protein
MSEPYKPESEADQQLAHYVLALLPDEETERLDEATIVDDEVALRLRVVEQDLVDAYVSGTLDGELLERFESHYLESPRRRARVRFARSFLRAVDRAAPVAVIYRDHEMHRVGEPVDAPRPVTSSSDRVAPRRRFASILNIAAGLLLVACVTLLFQTVRLRNALNEPEKESTALDNRAREREQPLSDERGRAAATGPVDRTDTTSGRTIALVLLPQTRAVAPIPVIAITPGASHVAFELRLESNDFPRYQSALKDPASNRIVWRSGPLTATSDGDTPAVVVTVPGRVLKPQHYSLDLSGLRASGGVEIVGSYAVHIVPR